MPVNLKNGDCHALNGIMFIEEHNHLGFDKPSESAGGAFYYTIDK